MTEKWGAKIVTLKEFTKMRPQLGRVVVASGGFDPIHPGHISYLFESKKYGDTLAVIVNGDAFLTAKKGKPFQDLQTRCLIVSGIIGVDYVIPFEIEGESTVAAVLETIKPDIFCKGGDRINKATIPEWDTCQRNGIKIITGVGDDKQWSSSWFLKNWTETDPDNK